MYCTDAAHSVHHERYLRRMDLRGRVHVRLHGAVGRRDQHLAPAAGIPRLLPGGDRRRRRGRRAARIQWETHAAGVRVPGILPVRTGRPDCLHGVQKRVHLEQILWQHSKCQVLVLEADNEPERGLSDCHLEECIEDSTEQVERNFYRWSV
jgi:hypothetical protein